MNQNVLLIAIQDIRPHCQGEPDVTERLKKAMRRAHELWLTTEDDLRFTAALEAAYHESPEKEDKDIIERSVRSLATVGAAMKGVPIDFNAMESMMAAKDGKTIKVLPLMKLWLETKDEPR